MRSVAIHRFSAGAGRGDVQASRTVEARHREVSVGVATGEAYFGPVGRRTGDALGAWPAGEPGSAAARARTAGQVLADQATYRWTHQAFAIARAGMASPGKDRREVAGALARPAKTRGIEGLRAELIGRDEELAKLEAALARFQAGQGQVVALISEAGLGKSRLVAELKAGGAQPESAHASRA